MKHGLALGLQDIGAGLLGRAFVEMSCLSLATITVMQVRLQQQFCLPGLESHGDYQLVLRSTSDRVDLQTEETMHCIDPEAGVKKAIANYSLWLPPPLISTQNFPNSPAPIILFRLRLQLRDPGNRI